MSKNFYNHIPAYLLPLVNLQTLKSFSELIEYSLSCDNPILLNEEMNKILYRLYPNEASMEYQKFLSNTYQEIFWERAFGSFDSPLKYALMNNLDRLKTNSNLSISLKIFFNRKNEYTELELGFFIQLILTMANKISYLPALFWTSEKDTVYLYIFFNKPSARQFLDVIFKIDSGEKIIQAENYEDEKKLMNSLHSSYKKLLEKNKLTLSDFLRTIR